MTNLLAHLKQFIVDGDDSAAETHVKNCLEAGIDPKSILDGAIVAGIEEAGNLWRNNIYFMPDIILSAVAFKAAMAEVKPKLTGRTSQGGRVLIGTVKGDMHDLGKSIVEAMLSGAGFDVIDLGVDVDVSTFVEKTRQFKPDILGLGAYMTTTMLVMRDVIVMLEKEGLRDKVKVMIGGIPTSEEFAAEIGADGWGKDALGAVVKARELANGIL